MRKTHPGRMMPLRTADRAAEKPRAGGSFPIVGIGASAGGLEAFWALLNHLPLDTGMGLVLVQHLEWAKCKGQDSSDRGSAALDRQVHSGPDPDQAGSLKWVFEPERPTVRLVGLRRSSSLARPTCGSGAVLTVKCAPQFSHGRRT